MTIKRKIGALSPYFLLVVLFLVCGTSDTRAADAPFDGPANWGGTGLMETPTARVLKEGRYRIGVSQIDPYRYYYGAVSPLKGLEIDGRITEVLDVPALTAAYGNFKDKAVDLKYQFLPEGKWWPAVAVGLMDPHGTRIYPSQYVVMSKQIYPFDFTLGFGNGRFGKKPLSSQGEGVKLELFEDPNTWLSDSQFFGGIEFAPFEKFSVMVEYSPIRYHEQTSDPAQGKYFREAVPSPFNFGIRWRPYRWTDIAVSWQRGNQLGVNLSVAFDLGNPLIPIYDPVYREKPEQRLKPLEERIAMAMYRAGFMDIGVIQAGEDLLIEAENDKYYYQPRAIGVALRAVHEIVPPWVRRIRLVLMNKRIPVLSFETVMSDYALFEQERITVNEFLQLSNMKTDVTDTRAAIRQYVKHFDYGIKPEFRLFLNDPSGFFKYRLGASGWAAYRPWRGASLVAGTEIYPLNNVSSVNEPLSKPVRSDLVPYQQDNVALTMLMFEQIDKFRHEIYGRVAAGLLEIQYAGLDGEVAKPFFGGRLLVGVSGSVVKKREAGNPFMLKDNDYKDYYSTAFFNTRLNIPELEASIDLKTGQFLAGDTGTRITLSKFFNGVILSVWYSATDTSGFTDSFNRGYHDKGIAITIPLFLFRGTDSRTAYSFAVSPWTRDVAQDIAHHTSLFDYMGRNTGAYLEKDRRMMR
jgi:hypothetical protein